jgi:hypothetical protein
VNISCGTKTSEMTADTPGANRAFDGNIACMRSEPGRVRGTSLAAVEVSSDGRRLKRSSVLLAGIALLCAIATVAFGIWMAGYTQSLYH